MGTVREELCRAIPALERAGIETPRLDAELLLADALRTRRIDLFAHPERALDDVQSSRWSERLGRRLRREPLPYITGRVEFYGLSFLVGPAALIPRPETELLVDAVAARVPAEAHILDVGTGTGCIALALAHRLPHARLIALEPSPAALELARQNASALGLEGRVVWLRGRFPEALTRSDRVCTPDEAGTWREAPGRELDAIVSNPPYIPSAEVERLAPELREFEPRMALDGGVDGLSVIRALLEDGPRLLQPGGLLALEMAAGQSDRVREVAEERSAWREVELLPDLAGIPRVMVARCAG